MKNLTSILLFTAAVSLTAQTSHPVIPVIDGHNDLAWQIRERAAGAPAKLDLSVRQASLTPPLHTDIPRLRDGGVKAQIWSVWVPADLPSDLAVITTLEQIDIVHKLTAHYGRSLEFARSADDIDRISRAGRVASLIGIEGGHSIGNSLAVLRQMYALGARAMTITHSKTTAWADSSSDVPQHDGLAPFGVAVVKEMNRLGMLVDLSHVSPATMHDALDATTAPVVFTHSSARAIVDHPRNVPDDVLKRVAANGGIVMITFVDSFVSEEARHYDAREKAEELRFNRLFPHDPARAKQEFEAWKKANPVPPTTIRQVADHVDHVRQLAGIDHIGIGGDFDGHDTLPVDLDDVSKYQNLFAELRKRGYSEADLRKIGSENFLRVLRKVEDVARSQRNLPPSEAAMTPLGDPRKK